MKKNSVDLEKGSEVVNDGTKVVIAETTVSLFLKRASSYSCKLAPSQSNSNAHIASLFHIPFPGRITWQCSALIFDSH